MIGAPRSGSRQTLLLNRGVLGFVLVTIQEGSFFFGPHIIATRLSVSVVCAELELVLQAGASHRQSRLTLT